MVGACNFPALTLSKVVLVDIEGKVLAKEVLEMKGVYAILEAEI